MSTRARVLSPDLKTLTLPSQRLARSLSLSLAGKNDDEETPAMWHKAIFTVAHEGVCRCACVCVPIMEVKNGARKMGVVGKLDDL